MCVNTTLLLIQCELMQRYRIVDANSCAAALILLILTTVDGNTPNTDNTASGQVCVLVMVLEVIPPASGSE